MVHIPYSIIMMNSLDVTQHIIMNDVTHHIPYNFHIFHYNHIHIPSSPLCFSCASRSLSTKLICDTLAMPSTMPCSAGVLCSTKLERASMLDDFRVKRLDFCVFQTNWVETITYAGCSYGNMWVYHQQYCMGNNGLKLKIMGLPVLPQNGHLTCLEWAA